MKQNAIFRGKTELGVWVYGYYMYSELQDKHFILGESKDYGFQKEEVIAETVGQFTGLADKNGVKIFNGDILNSSWFLTNVVKNKKVDDSEHLNWHEVYFDTDKKYNCIALKTIKTTRSHNFGVGNILHSFLYTITDKSEVVGNIHDNPELSNS